MAVNTRGVPFRSPDFKLCESDSELRPRDYELRLQDVAKTLPRLLRGSAARNFVGRFLPVEIVVGNSDDRVWHARQSGEGAQTTAVNEPQGALTMRYRTAAVVLVGLATLPAQVVTFQTARAMDDPLQYEQLIRDLGSDDAAVRKVAAEKLATAEAIPLLVQASQRRGRHSGVWGRGGTRRAARLGQTRAGQSGRSGGGRVGDGDKWASDCARKVR